ncbi:DUF6199 family natural product biosynthesis protein [Fictibacillus aquaticus]|uniref:DUF6199 domain-containing protein n=1 Tax=Fictibacillus aquaticus TaxID=2021314 RepID=A0A235FDC1_9BACL|nr:DUF6199 family natural product biosynthesis protein [Fictibacillus aquaticus]OYD59348.1 hypothetical protein CGZ90_05510 [Fictibacillus aquaticus]
MDAVVGVLVVLIGLFFVKYPYFIWETSIGWQLKDAEPSDMALKVNRIIGYILITIGAFYALDYFFEL